MTNWTLALALWGACVYATGCEGEISGGTSAGDAGSEEDAGPLPCNIKKIVCGCEDTDAGSEWACSWVDLCGPEHITPWLVDASVEEEDAGT